MRKRRINERRSGWSLNVKGGNGKKSESGKESGGTARGKRSESGNGRGNENVRETEIETETKTVTAGPGKGNESENGRETEALTGVPTAADPGEAKKPRIMYKDTCCN